MPKLIKEVDEIIPRRSLRIQMKKKNSPQTPNEEKEVLFQETKIELPNELLSTIFSLVPTSSLISVGMTCQRWLGILSGNWFRANHSPSPDEIRCAIELIRSGHLPAFYVTNLATSIQTAWPESCWPGGAEVRCADALVTSGHLPEHVLTALASRIRGQENWIEIYADAAKVECAAALAATGRLTSVKDMTLEDLELPSSEDIPSLVAQLSWEVHLINVTGDLVPLLTSLNSYRVELEDMALDEAATRGLLRALQYGVEMLVLRGSVTLHLPTLMNYDGRGKCKSLHCMDTSRSTYLPQMTAWAEGVGWVGWDFGERFMWRRKY